MRAVDQRCGKEVDESDAKMKRALKTQVLTFYSAAFDVAVKIIDIVSVFLNILSDD